VSKRFRECDLNQPFSPTDIDPPSYDGSMYRSWLEAASPQQPHAVPCYKLHPSQAVAVAELYDPATGTFSLGGSLNGPRFGHTATLLNGGNVLIAGGGAAPEVYNPASGGFALAQGSGLGNSTATLLNNGTVLAIQGGSVSLYDPAAGGLSAIGGLNLDRGSSAIATLLLNGTVLVAGGFEQGYLSQPLASVELYQPPTLTPAGLVSLAVSPQNLSLPPGTSQPLVATGTFSDQSTQTMASVTWSSSDSTVVTVTNDASNRAHAYGVNTGAATISACAGTVCSSAGVALPIPSLPVPAITSLSPLAGTAGTVVTIAGSGFGAEPGSVTFNGVAAAAASWADTQIVVAVPAGASTGNVVGNRGGSGQQ
jgi:hypothetical protein